MSANDPKRTSPALGTGTIGHFPLLWRSITTAISVGRLPNLFKET